jgi:hypothetical protein
VAGRVRCYRRKTATRHGPAAISQRFPLLRTCAPGWSACTALSRATTSSMGRPESIRAIGIRTATGGSSLCDARARSCWRTASSRSHHQGGPASRPAHAGVPAMSLDPASLRSTPGRRTRIATRHARARWPAASRMPPPKLPRDHRIATYRSYFLRAQASSSPSLTSRTPTGRSDAASARTLWRASWSNSSALKPESWTTRSSMLSEAMSR